MCGGGEGGGVYMCAAITDVNQHIASSESAAE